jgi:hypothetical protein
VASSGEDAINPIIEKLIEVPSMPAKEDTLQNFAGWSSLPTNIQGPKNIVALYNFIYRVQFFDGDNNVIHTEWVPAGQGIEDPINKLAEIPTKTSTAQYNYVYSSWEQDFNIISAPLNVYAIFTSILRDYEVIFMNGNTEL